MARARYYQGYVFPGDIGYNPVAAPYWLVQDLAPVLPPPPRPARLPGILIINLQPILPFVPVCDTPRRRPDASDVLRLRPDGSDAYRRRDDSSDGLRTRPPQCPNES